MEVNLETRSLDPSKISFQPFNPLESRCLGGSENTYAGSNFFTIFFFLTSLHTLFSQKILRRDFVRIPSPPLPPPELIYARFPRSEEEAAFNPVGRAARNKRFRLGREVSTVWRRGVWRARDRKRGNLSDFRLFLGGTTRRTICCSKLWKQFDTNSKSCKKTLIRDTLITQGRRI